MDSTEKTNFPLPKTQPGLDLLAETEEFYFWLMRSSLAPQIHAATFQLLSQIMRISQIAGDGGGFLTHSLENELLKSLSSIKEQVKDGKIQIARLFDPIQTVLQKLTHENPKALLVARATEIEYLFCINSTFAPPDIRYKETFKNYLKTVVDSIHHSSSDTQAKAISQIMSQITENPKNFCSDPQKTLQEEFAKAGILIVSPLKDPPNSSSFPEAITG